MARLAKVECNHDSASPRRCCACCGIVVNPAIPKKNCRIAEHNGMRSLGRYGCCPDCGEKLWGKILDGQLSPLPVEITIEY